MPAKKSKKKKRISAPAEDSGANIITTVKASSISALIAIGISAALAALLASLAMLFDNPDSLTSPFALTAIYLSAFLSGIISSKRCSDTAFMCGILSGGMLMIFYMFASMFIPRDIGSSHKFIISLLLHALVVVFAILGGVVGKKSSSRRHKPKR